MVAMFRPALSLLAAFTLITGLAYPLAVTGFARLFFPRQAGGNLIIQDRHVVGSALIGQPFDNPRYFWGRPSATASFPDNAGASAGSNLGQANPELRRQVAAHLAALHAADPDNARPVPVDLVTASASGLDPDISPAAADYQVERVARARGLAVAKVRALVAASTQNRTFGLLGEQRVNVLKLNLALDELR
jgi:potassium-transporting ATPase KdpC subunit